MKKEKSLSEKEIGVHFGDMKKIFDEKRVIGSKWTTSILLAGDVREAVKRLRERIIKVNKEAVGYDKNYKYRCALDLVDLDDITDEVFGEDLTK